MVDHKLDIFEALSASDRQDGGWLSRQPEESRKAFAPPVFLRWASSITGGGLESEYTILLVNERVNLHANELMGAHPDLLFRLAASCGLGARKRHEWIPGSKRRAAPDAARSLIEQAHPLAADDEISILMTLYTSEEFRTLAEGSGRPAEEIKTAIKAFAGTKVAGSSGDAPAKPKRTRRARPGE